MENIKNIRSITIKSGNKNKSINSYIKKICRVIKLTSANLELIAYGKFYILKKDNNINKLITIIEIIKRYLPELQFSNKVCWAYELNKDISNNSRKGPSQEDDTKIPCLRTDIVIDLTIISKYDKDLDSLINDSFNKKLDEDEKAGNDNEQVSNNNSAEASSKGKLNKKKSIIQKCNNSEIDRICLDNINELLN